MTDSSSGLALIDTTNNNQQHCHNQQVCANSKFSNHYSNTARNFDGTVETTITTTTGGLVNVNKRGFASRNATIVHNSSGSNHLSEHNHQRPANPTISSSVTLAGRNPSPPPPPPPSSPPTPPPRNEHNNTYSELLRYRSQEFYTKLSLNPSTDTESEVESKADSVNNNNVSTVRYKGCESLNDLSQSNLYSNPVIDCQQQQQQQPRINSLVNSISFYPSSRQYQHHHPHYRNHLHKAYQSSTTTNNNVTGLLRSNSSLSLSVYSNKRNPAVFQHPRYHQYLYPQSTSNLFTTTTAAATLERVPKESKQILKQNGHHKSTMNNLGVTSSTSGAGNAGGGDQLTRPYTGPLGTAVVDNSYRRNTLTRSSSSGVDANSTFLHTIPIVVTSAQPTATVTSSSALYHSPQHAIHYQQQQQYQLNGANSRSSSSLVAAQTEYPNAQYHHSTYGTTPAYITSGIYNGPKLTVKNPLPTVTTTTASVNHHQHRMPARFPTTTSLTGKANPSIVKFVSGATVMSTVPGTLSVYSVAASSQPPTTTISTATTVSRTLFPPTNMFESKKNKLFGSVSSIDIQCLKDSQKVSVVERKSSRIGRSPKAAAAASTTATSSTTSSFFKLFTSSTSKAKHVIPFGFGSGGGGGGAVNGGGGQSTASSASSVASSSSSNQTVTARSETTTNEIVIVNGSGNSATTDTVKRINGERVKSNSLDSASSIPATAATAAADSLLFRQSIDTPMMPANESLFRKNFTFYDLLSSTNFNRLFEDSTAGSGSTNTVSSSSSSSSSSSVVTSEYYRSTTNGSTPVTTFESSTLSSTSSYSSCTSSMSSASHQYYNSYSSSAVAAKQSVISSAPSSGISIPTVADVSNDLLAPSPNFLNEIGSEKQYSIDLRWTNKADQQADQIENDVPINASSTATMKQSATSKYNQLHTPSFARRINIFSELSPFAVLTQHSVMSDLYGSTNGSTNLLSVSSSTLTKKSDIDFNDLDDGFGSLSSVSLGSSYPLLTNGVLPSSRCPFSTAAQTCNVLEMDYGTNFYRTHFRDFEHQNWLQVHEKYGPIVVSLRKERVKNGSNSNVSIRWRVIVRTTSLIPLRGSISTLPSICLPSAYSSSSSLDNSSRRSSSHNNSDSFNINSVRDVLTLVMPKNVCVSNFRLGSPTAVPLLLKLDELSQNTEYKIGVLYAYGNQHSEEEFYNNILDYSTTSKNPFYDFMSLIASRVRLKDFKGYKAGLDVLNDTTGEYSWTSKFGHVDIMFHVCTELPFTETNRQQLPRKRHIGNDIVTIVFLHENFCGSSFTPALIRSKFQQVFIIVKPVQNGKYYRVAVARHKLVPLFGPPLKPYYTRHELKDFILTKIINAENACHSVNKFAEMAKRTRNEYLTELVHKHSLTQTVHHVDSTLTSNSLNSFKKLFGSSNSGGSSGNISSAGCNDGTKRSKSGDTKSLGVFGGNHILNGIKDPPTLLGGILFAERWLAPSLVSRLYVHDFSTSREIQVSLLLSNEAILVIDASTLEVIWAAPVTSVIGWTDSSGVFATSPTTTSSASVIGIREKYNPSKIIGDKRAKSMDSDPLAQSSNSCRQLRLYYHQGECIQIIKRLVNTSATTTYESASVSKGKHQKNLPIEKDDDSFLHLIRVLELITRKSELREIVIKRKNGSNKSSVASTPEHRSTAVSPPQTLVFEPNGCCGSDFGFSLNMTTGIIDAINDQTLFAYHLTPGSKVCEIAKISFAELSLDELQELVNSSVIICLTFTEFDFYHNQPRCNCPWPQAALLQQRLKSQHTPPSEYENLPLMPKNVSSTTSPLKSTSGANSGPGVKSIHITHAQTLPQTEYPPAHQVLMNVSSTSSNSSYYSTNTPSSNQSPSHSYSVPNQLYAARSSTNLSYQSPVKVAHSQSATSSPANVCRSRSTTIAGATIAGATAAAAAATGNAINNGNHHSSLKENLIRLITMDNSPNTTAEFESTTSDLLQENASRNGAHYFASNGAKPGSVYRMSTQQTPDDTYSTYSNSRFSTASSTQYSSLGRNASTSTNQIHLNSNTAATVPIISGHLARSSTNYDVGSVMPVESNDCFLLTAQPVRVESNNSSSNNSISGNAVAQQQLTTTAAPDVNLNPMSVSCDSANSLFNSLISSHSSDTIGDIVWPSMHTSIDRQTAVFHNLQSTLNRLNQDLQSGNTAAGASNLTEEVRKLSLEKDVLNDTISKLREENQRLHIESQTASQQLRKLTEWFFNTGTTNSNASSSGSQSSASNCSNAGTVGMNTNSSTSSQPTASTTTMISIQQQSQPQPPETIPQVNQL